MEWAQLALEYVRALAWPGVVVGIVLAFRTQIAAKIADLKDASTPVGGASFFDREAKALEKKAEAAAERQEEANQADSGRPPDAEASGLDSPGGPVSVTSEDIARSAATHRQLREQLAQRDAFVELTAAWVQLQDPPDFEAARAIAKDSPRAAVLLAYADLEKSAQAAWTITRSPLPARRRDSPVQVLRTLAQSGGMDPEFAAVAKNLIDLRAKVAHGDPEASDITLEGAMDFIGACDQLSQAIASNAKSRLRHPSRAGLVQQWVDWAQREGIAAPATADDDPAA